jgi:hypothetical protein
MLIRSKFEGYSKDGIRLYPKKDEAAPDPRIGEATMRQIDLAEKQWAEYSKEGGDRDWLRSVTEDALDIQRGSADKAAELTDYQLGMMKFSDDRYRNNTIPYQDKLDAEIEDMYSAPRIEQRVGAVQSDVAAGMDNTQAQMRRGLDRRGVNPNSGAAMALENSNSVAKASAMTSAANKTRQAMEQAGLATKFQSLGAKLGIAGLGSTNAGLATSAMGTGLAAANGMSGSAAGMINTNNSTFGSTMSGMSAGISGANTNAANSIRASENQGDMMGSIIGAGAQLGAAYMTGGASLAAGSDRRLKTNIQKVGRDVRTGLSIYTFEYKTEPGVLYEGVMADEVQAKFPDAVVTDQNGYMSVIYSMLGIEFRQITGDTV